MDITNLSLLSSYMGIFGYYWVFLVMTDMIVMKVMMLILHDIRNKNSVCQVFWRLSQCASSNLPPLHPTKPQANTNIRVWRKYGFYIPGGIVKLDKMSNI